MCGCPNAWWFCEDPPHGECWGQQEGSLGSAGGPVSATALDAVLLESSPTEVPVVVLLVRGAEVSDTVEGWLLATAEAASEAGSEVGGFELFMEALVVCDSILEEVVGTTVGSSSSTVRSTTSAAFCLKGCITVEILLRLRGSCGRLA